jgi:hypothetical protein
MITPRRTSCFILSFALLSACALVRNETPERIVRVKLVADGRLREKNPRWRETAAGVLESASDFYGREFGIRFVAASIEPWELEESSPFVTTLLRQLMEKFPPGRDAGYDITVGLTGERVAFYYGGRGLAILGKCDKGLGNYLVTSVMSPYRYTGYDSESEAALDVVALIHELGHIFGAEHTEDTGSIMHVPFDHRDDFDAKSRAIIMKNKFCPFAK